MDEPGDDRNAMAEPVREGDDLAHADTAVRPDRQAEALDLELEAARPDADSVEMDELRARLERALFDDVSRPPQLGRFVLLELLGRGGMGAVYSAYDPELDRRVALKVLHPELRRGRARAELLREARALAKLSHPNVVPVHDVVTVGERVVLVMEHVDGMTLSEWLASAPRSWSKVLEVYRQAGRGLAAAHDLGIVHRDFKPQNAVVGDDGRVRVLDFGLARSGDELAAGEAIGGTPAYMAPEQFGGAEVTAAADQFGFCAALYGALYGTAPFAGRTAEELKTNVEAGRLTSPPRDRSVPRWIHAAVVRGLAIDPADRHRSMRALVEALGRDPARRRRRLAAAAGGLVLVGVTAWALARGGDRDVAVCEGGVEEVAGIWNADRRGRLLSAFAAVGGAYAAEISEIVVSRLDAYGAEYAAMHRSACLTHRRGEQSDRLFDRRMVCLSGRLAALDSAVSVLLEVDRSDLSGAMEVVANLPDVDFCADVEALASALPIPEDPELRRRVNDLRERLSAVSALQHAGRLPEALERARALRGEAEALGYGPVRAEAALAVGRVMLIAGSFEQAAGALGRAEALALEHDLLPAAIEAAARRLYSEARTGTPLDAIARQLAVIEPLSRRLEADSFARLLLLNNVGVAHMAAGDRDAARRYFAGAYAALEPIDEPPPELLSIVKNLAMVTPDRERRVALARQGWIAMRRQLGAGHPLSLEHAVGYAHYVPDPLVARRLLRETCEIYATQHPDQLRSLMRCLYTLGLLEADLGDRERATEVLARVAALPFEPGDDPARLWRQLAAGYAALYAGRGREATRAFRAALALLPETPATWWDRERAAHAHLGLGLERLAAGVPTAAAADLAAAVDLFAALLPINEDVENRQRLALARTALGRAVAAGGQQARARRLFDQAAAFYRSASATAYRAQLEELARLRSDQ